MKLRVHPARNPLRGHYRPPGDKSVSHRAALFGGLATGETLISGFLEAADTRASLEAMRALGAEIEESAGRIRIRGGRLHPPSGALDLGNSGTGMRLLTGALAGHPDLVGAEITLIGDASLNRRPMGRVIEPLLAMGARIECRDGTAPLRIWPRPLSGRRHRLPVASAQVKSALLLAGLCARGETWVAEPGTSRDHTERLLPAFGAPVLTAGREVGIAGPLTLSGSEIQVPGDLSSAAFVIAAGLLVPGSEVEIEPVGLNPTRDGFLRILNAMAPGNALEVRQHPAPRAGSEPAGLVRVRHGDLVGTEVPADWVPLAIDEFPVIMALAASAEGRTVITAAAELRVKESDRLAVMSGQLLRLGVQVEETADGAVIQGGPIHGGSVDSFGDHRIAMSLAVLGLVAQGPVEIAGAEWIRTSYPGFVDDLRALGAHIEERP